ncbi:MAG: MTH938/NDUFAF3 family protein [Pseudorhodoplanes sp.]
MAGEASSVPHFPGQAVIETYGRGGFRFAGMSHRGSLLCVPSGIYGWAVTAPESITADSLAPVLTEATRIGLLLIGTGNARWPLSSELLGLFARHKISVETSQTGQAANTYNILLEEGRRVAAALIAVD